jgi:hypothetical protein
MQPNLSRLGPNARVVTGQSNDPPKPLLATSYWKRACIAASCLLGIATFVVFVIHPGGFEGQVGWFFLVAPRFDSDGLAFGPRL